MKLFLPLVAFLTVLHVGMAQQYKPSDADSKVHFVIKNFGIKTGGDFSKLDGVIFFNPDDLAASKMDVTVKATTIDTDNSIRDKSLREEYFESDKYPDIRLTSTKIEKTNKTVDGFYYLTGNLIIKGISREISFPFKAEKKDNHFLFTGEFTINRLDYKVGTRSSVLSDQVHVSLTVLAKKQ